MEKDEVALEIRDGSEALRYSGKDCALIIYLFIYFIYLRFVFLFFFCFFLFFFSFHKKKFPSLSLWFSFIQDFFVEGGNDCVAIRSQQGRGCGSRTERKRKLYFFLEDSLLANSPTIFMSISKCQ